MSKFIEELPQGSLGRDQIDQVLSNYGYPDTFGTMIKNNMSPDKKLSPQSIIRVARLLQARQTKAEEEAAAATTSTQPSTHPSEFAPKMA